MTTFTRADIVAAARGWIGTPFHHQARLLGVGVDCIQHVIAVAEQLGSVPQGFNIEPYARLPHAGRLMALAREHMVELPADHGLQIGNIVVVAIEREPQHFGVIGDYRHGGLSMIHAAANARPPRVIEHRYMPSTAMKFVAAFDLPGVN